MVVSVIGRQNSDSGWSECEGNSLMAGWLGYVVGAIVW